MRIKNFPNVYYKKTNNNFVNKNVSTVVWTYVNFS